MDSDSVLIWNCNWEDQSGQASAPAEHNVDGSMMCVPLKEAGVYDLIKRARLYVNGKIISELNEVGKYLTLKNNFTPHEVKTEVNDYFSYADHAIQNVGGKISTNTLKIQRCPQDKELGTFNGTTGHKYRVEASLKLHQLFAMLKDAQLDTSNIHGKIMIEIDWNVQSVQDNVTYVGDAIVNAHKNISVSNPRLILDFLTYNDEVTAAIKGTIFGDGPGVNMPYREVVLVRKTYNVGNNAASEQNEDFAIGMTGRAVQKVWVAKVANQVNPNQTLGQCRSDLLASQKWNMRVNDLQIFDRDVDNRAEEYNYVQQCGEAQWTAPPGVYERRAAGTADQVSNNADDDLWNTNMDELAINATVANVLGGASAVNQHGGVKGEIRRGLGIDVPVMRGAVRQSANQSRDRLGRQNYLAIPLAKYAGQPQGDNETPMNAMRIGSTPLLFNLNYNAAGNDADTTGRNGTLYFWVEYLKMMNLKNGEITVMDL